MGTTCAKAIEFVPEDSGIVSAGGDTWGWRSDWTSGRESLWLRLPNASEVPSHLSGVGIDINVSSCNFARNATVDMTIWRGGCDALVRVAHVPRIGDRCAPALSLPVDAEPMYAELARPADYEVDASVMAWATFVQQTWATSSSAASPGMKLSGCLMTLCPRASHGTTRGQCSSEWTLLGEAFLERAQQRTLLRGMTVGQPLFSELPPLLAKDLDAGAAAVAEARRRGDDSAASYRVEAALLSQRITGMLSALCLKHGAKHALRDVALAVARPYDMG